MNKTRILVLSSVIATLVTANSAYAGVIAGNFGPGNSYNSLSFWGVEGSGVYQCCGIAQAIAFTPGGTENWTLTQIDLALAYVSGTNSAVVTLNSDSGGFPGATLATWDLSGFPVGGSPCCTIETMTPSSPISLSSGTQYWIMVSPGATDTWAGWYVNNTGWTGLQLETNNLGGWGLVTASFSAFEVQGNTPEPASGALLAFGAVALSALRLRKKRKSQ